MNRILLSCLALSAWAASPSSAQPAATPPQAGGGIPSPQQVEAAVPQRLREAGFRPTRAAPLDQSLEDLLNAGYGVVSAGQGTAGSAVFALRDAAGRRWAFCTLSRAPGDAPGTSNSQCTALN